MARFQCRACGFEGHGIWTGELICPACGGREKVRAAVATSEITEKEIAEIEAAFKEPVDGLWDGEE